MPAARSSVRIIGGRWRGTRIEVEAGTAVRPSGDRIRETLFNWLAPDIDGARCLDLFAGTGVLGFEAVSRGAAGACLIERDPTLVRALSALGKRLNAAEVQVQRADALAWLAGPAEPYDIVFVDPPFAAGLATAVLERLANGWLAAHGVVYLEQAHHAPEPASCWRVRKAGSTRQVSYKLIELTG